MTNEQWQYLVDHWGSSDPTVQEEIAKLRDADKAATDDLEKRLEEQTKRGDDLLQQNVDLNKTNMNLIMRVLDPEAPGNEPPPDYEPPELTDYGSFVK